MQGVRIQSLAYATKSQANAWSRHRGTQSQSSSGVTKYVKRPGSRYRASQRCSCRTSTTLACAVNPSAGSIRDQCLDAHPRRVWSAELVGNGCDWKTSSPCISAAVCESNEIDGAGVCYARLGPRGANWRRSWWKEGLCFSDM